MYRGLTALLLAFAPWCVMGQRSPVLFPRALVVLEALAGSAVTP